MDAAIRTRRAPPRTATVLPRAAARAKGAFSQKTFDLLVFALGHAASNKDPRRSGAMQLASVIEELEFTDAADNRDPAKTGAAGSGRAMRNRAWLR